MSEARIPPRSEAAECAVLGAMLLEREAIALARELIIPGNFYLEVHRLLYNAICAVADDGPVDVVTVGEYLRQHDLLDQCGGQAYLDRLLDAAPTAAHLAHYAAIVRDHALRREIIETTTRALDTAYESGANVESILAGFNAWSEAAADAVGAEDVTMSAQELRAKAAPVEWLAEGLVPVAAMVMLVGPPGIGKTWIAMHIAGCVATGASVFGRYDTQQANVLYWDEENGVNILANRVQALLDGTCPETGLDFIVGRSWLLTDPRTPPRLLRLIRERQARLLVIDCLRDIHEGNENDSGEMVMVMGTLKRLVRKTACSILILHHSRKPSMLGGDAGDRSRGSSAILASVDQHIDSKRLTHSSIAIAVTKTRAEALSAAFAVEFFEPAEGVMQLRYTGPCEDAEEPTDRAKSAIMDFVIAAGGKAARADIVNALLAGGMKTRTIDAALKELVSDDHRLMRGGFEGRKRMYEVNLRKVMSSDDD